MDAVGEEKQLIKSDFLILLFLCVRRSFINL